MEYRGLPVDVQNSPILVRYCEDLLALWLATAVLLGLIFMLPDNPARVVLGIPFVLFSPGYSLLAALYARNQELNGVERLGLSLGMSLAVVPLIGLALNYTPWGIRLTPILVSLVMFNAACSIEALRRRKLLPPAERFVATVAIHALRTFPWRAFGASVALSVIILALGVRFGVLGGSQVGTAFTEFYVLGPGGKAEEYPGPITAGQAVAVTLGIVNHERRPARYAIQIRPDINLLRTIEGIALAPEQKWEERVIFTLPRPGKRIKIEFLLLRDNSSVPHRVLHLWVEVRAP
jgi:uncharacterized membrane protein